MTVEGQAGDPGSMLTLYRTGLRRRRELAALGDGTSGSGSITVNVIDNTTKAYIQATPADATKA